MGFDHRGRPVGTNHSSTPLLAALVARQMNRDIYTEHGLMYSNPPRHLKVSLDDAQSMLNAYRETRDNPKAHPSQGSPARQQIRKALEGRHDVYSPMRRDVYGTE